MPFEASSGMIKLTRLNNSEFFINADMIEFVDSVPDTIITLLSGKKITVTEPVDIVIERVIEYRRKINQTQYSGAQS